MKPFLLAAALSSTASLAVAETWHPDPSHTNVSVTWNHAGFSLQTMQFHEVTGTLDFEPGDIAGAKADFGVVAASVDSGVEALDAELIGPQFLDAQSHPEIRFVSTSVEQTGEMSVKAAGEMTMKGVTKPVVFDIVVHNLGAHPVGGFLEYNQGEWLGMTATATIKRSDFGVDAFIPVGSDELEIVINTEMRAGGWE
ncbi:YceI family protein [uncultured Tateyamaria sp.]|uniref:YceI family protein n=1 Tax=uncultured Tateyamaria sp. TaxID=455651 RepID=UPI0026279E3E|nr:YceI family protein [uncultured Tateyamaria sp.]